MSFNQEYVECPEMTEIVSFDTFCKECDYYQGTKIVNQPTKRTVIKCDFLDSGKNKKEVEFI